MINTDFEQWKRAWQAAVQSGEESKLGAAGYDAFFLAHKADIHAVARQIAVDLDQCASNRTVFGVCMALRDIWTLFDRTSRELLTTSLLSTVAREMSTASSFILDLGRGYYTKGHPESDRDYIISCVASMYNSQAVSSSGRIALSEILTELARP